MAKKAIYPRGSTMLRGKKSWFYQDRGGLMVVAQKWDQSGNHCGCTLTNIPWSKLCAAVDNHRAVQRQKRAVR